MHSFWYNWKLKKFGKLDITYKGIDMKQHSIVTYLGSTLNNAMSGESLDFKTLKIFILNLAFCVGKKLSLSTAKAFMQCPSTVSFWLFLFCIVCQFLSGIKKEIKNCSKKYVFFCLNLDKIAHMSPKEFQILNWTVQYRFNQCVSSMVFKYVNFICSYYLDEILSWEKLFGNWKHYFVKQPLNRITRFLKQTRFNKYYDLFQINWLVQN